MDFLGEARLSRLGLVLLAAGLGCTGLASHRGLLFLGVTLMPLGTAPLSLRHRACPGWCRTTSASHGGPAHLGGVSRVLVPGAAGLLMDHFGVGVPFWLAGLLVLATLPFAWALARRAAAGITGHSCGTEVSSADVTGEFPVEKVVEGDWRK